MKITFQTLIPFVVMLLLLGCKSDKENSKTIIDSFVHLPSSGWKYDDVKKFSFSITDTAQAYDLLVKVRNEKQYAYSNLWLYITIITPVEHFKRDRVEITLADDMGYWQGKSAGRSLHEIDYSYKKGFKFPYLGIYTIELQHAMRDSVLRKITDIGITIQPAK